MCTLRAAVISALDFALVEAANGNAITFNVKPFFVVCC